MRYFNMKYDFYVFRENIFFYENLSIAEEILSRFYRWSLKYVYI